MEEQKSGSKPDPLVDTKQLEKPKGDEPKPLGAISEIAEIEKKETKAEHNPETAMKDANSPEDQKLPVKASEPIKEIKKEHPMEVSEESKGGAEKKELELAKGCIVGAFCGDALGSYLEFKSTVSEEELAKALELIGGGPFGLEAGQITDDSELGLCLLQGLCKCSEGELNTEIIADWYSKWIDSHPFDCGATIGGALRGSQKIKEGKAGFIKSRADYYNTSSQSNGSLMRITPLALFASKIEDVANFIAVIKAEVQLTHSNPIAKNAAVCYCWAIRELLKNDGNRKAAIDSVDKLIKEEIKDKEIESWLKAAMSKDKFPIAANTKIGWVKIAFIYAFKYLYEDETYESAMRKILHQGGDTDTNACIVGGLIGAAMGLKAIPQKYKDTTLRYECGRPDFLVPSKVNVIEKVEELMKKRRSEVRIV